MKAYKFRSSSQIAFAFDIIINSRLYCANWKECNDPTEGLFFYQHSLTSDIDVINKRVNDIEMAKNKYKICSLSLTFDSFLLWAHYAGGFDGVAIEVELPDDDPNIRKVESRGIFDFVDMAKFTEEDDVARRLLFSKHIDWSYEKEIRILNESEWYKLKFPITRVIAGARMGKALFEVLNIVCTSKNITLNKVGIGDEGIDADYVTPYKFF